ncbi:EthD domain-containing protein [Anianabacter salinae]|uniref:EthD domain-containing protein n=1 Tax=Anianabacter salinae TaxID=2851023 RepID=UPI00225E6D69|nr:EthD domain-containing protein [Anianabacter salinae]MBV0911062.1 EthD domain-containing protein [Anianabacter salinae]
MTDREANRRITLIEKRADMTDKAFHAHWSGPHAEIARDLPGLVWYVQNHVQNVLWPQGQEVRHLGIAEIAFRDPKDIFHRIDGWARVDELRKDEGRFLSARYGCWTHAHDAPVLPSQRRIVVQFGQPTGDSADKVRRRIADQAAWIATEFPCHVEDCIGGSPDVLDDPPGCFLFVELPATGDIGSLMSNGLAPLRDLGVSAIAHVVHAEAKRLPIDLTLTAP